MSKTAKSADTANTADAEMPFEDALRKLEAIVDSMESEDLPLEALMARFEAGSRLTKICQAKLAEADLKIQQLEKNTVGELVLKPLDIAETIADK